MKRMPLWLKVTSPGFGYVPPPTIAAAEVVTEVWGQGILLFLSV